MEDYRDVADRLAAMVRKHAYTMDVPSDVVVREGILKLEEAIDLAIWHGAADVEVLQELHRRIESRAGESNVPGVFLKAVEEEARQLLSPRIERVSNNTGDKDDSQAT